MSIYDSLNQEQREAVFCTDGPLLLLAGAGSGKTRVLVHRIAYLIEEKKVKPWNIMAITFTNKAAKEMRERVDDMIGYGASDCWVSTFHSSCVRILRRDIDKLGYSANFSIYDTDDQKRLIKEVLKSLQYDTKQFSEKAMMNAISAAKEQYISPADYMEDAVGDFRREKIAKVYVNYQKQLETANALDFDDLLYKTVELFEHHPDVLEYWQERFRYIMVDEYQDTNGVQFIFIKQLASKYRNICVVGDDDQSIYKFRGADVRNILEFEDFFPESTVIKLEQNYRSTKNILNVANSVIRNNTARMDKTLYTDNDEGETTTFAQYQDNYKEAEAIADEVSKIVASGANYKDFAVLNRTNAQSRVFEEKFGVYNIPYKIVGGVSFYSRMEIRDIVAYLKLVNNLSDDQAMKRIINVPRRGIGQTTVEKINEFAMEREIAFFDAASMVEEISTISKATAKKIAAFVEMIDGFTEIADKGDIAELYDKVVEETGYLNNLVLEGTEDAKDRINNLEEFKSKIVDYENSEAEPSLQGFLTDVALISEVDNLVSDDAVTVMTIHSAKGLEFPYVFLSGMEEGIFPGYMTINSGNDEDMEEERRLFYVGATRAEKRLYLSASKRRMVNGQQQFNKVSRFIDEIDREYLNFSPTVDSSAFSSDFAADIFTKTKPVAMKPAYTLKSEPKKYKDAVKDDSPFEIDYKVGDRVRHIKFGSGTVKEITPTGSDYEVLVDYDLRGVRRSFASFAKLKKEE